MDVRLLLTDQPFGSQSQRLAFPKNLNLFFVFP